MFLGSNSTWILHNFYTKLLLDAVFHLHVCIHLSIFSHFFRTAFSLNLADAILWLQASSSYPAHLSLLSLSLNYHSVSLSHFTCNFRNCLFKASLSHPSSSNHNQKAESCLWSFCGVRLLCPCFKFSDRCHQTFYHFHSWEDPFVRNNRAATFRDVAGKNTQYCDAYKNIQQWEAAMLTDIISWFLCAPRASVLAHKYHLFIAGTNPLHSATQVPCHSNSADTNNNTWVCVS